MEPHFISLFLTNFNCLRFYYTTDIKMPLTIQICLTHNYNLPPTLNIGHWAGSAKIENDYIQENM